MYFCPSARLARRQGVSATSFGVATCPLIGVVLAALALVRPVASQQIIFPANPPAAPAEDDPYGVYLPSDRTLSRGMTRAKERLEAGEYNEALVFLQQVLDRNEDSFLDHAAVPDATNPNTRHGLKAAARDLLANLSTAGREMYLLLHSASAKRQLDAALATGNRAELAALVRRYFLTPPGYEAAIVLAQLEFDRGHPLSAAHLYEQLLADPAVAAPFEPQLSLLAAVSWQAAGQSQQAVSTLRALGKDDLQDHPVEIAGRQVLLPKPSQSDQELLAWLTEHIGLPWASNRASSDWITHRGDPSRNTQHSGGAPHLSARWQSRVVNDPRFESFLSNRAQQAEQQGVATIAAARPVATGNVVLMRTPKNVVALDWQTGKRIWETREEETSARDQYFSELVSGNIANDSNNINHPLEQRIWDDTLTMSLSADGERVFALSGVSLEQREQQNAWGGQAFGGAFDAGNFSPTNRLTAYELASEGKLAWEIDGAHASEDLSGAFFLGPPLAIDGTLYTLAEIRGAVYMLAIDPQTGQLRWRQQLVSLEQGITLDPQRRQNAASPSYSAGLLVCPTTAGAVVAIDTLRRELAWVYRYPRHADALARIARQGWQVRNEVSATRQNNRWLDSSAVIADGNVLITPAESAELHCLDLATGKLLWKKPREKSLFLAAADDDKVLLIGPTSVTALRLADGEPVWPDEHTELPVGALPSGFGYLSGDRYYLPLSSGQVVAINMQHGTLSGAREVRRDVAIGNLICHRGSVISQSTLFLDKFEQIEILRERAKEALAANPQDASAIRDLAEMRLLEGEFDEAVPMLKQAFALGPSDPLTREMLADALLQALTDNYPAYRDDLPLLRELVYRPQQQIDLLRIDAAGLNDIGQRMEAFSAYLHLADATSADPLALHISPVHSARSDNWIRARLQALWSEASPTEREAILRQLAQRTKAWGSSPTTAQLTGYLNHFDGLPTADDVRRKLIDNLFSEKEPLELEIELLRLAQSASPISQTVAQVLLTKSLIEQGRHEEAVTLARRLATRDLDAPAVDGKTPQQWLDLWQPELAAANAHAQTWPRGKVNVELQPANSNNRRPATRRAANEFQAGLRKLRLEQIAGPPLGPTQWFLAQDNSRVIGRNAAGKDVFRFNARRDPRNAIVQQFTGNSDLTQAARLGDLLFVTFGGQVLALDTRPAARDDNSELLWQVQPVGRIPVALPRATSGTGNSLYHPWSQRRRVTGAASMLVASLGPATPNGVVFHEGQRLRCVNPVNGETLWTRTDLPVGCELFGDDQFVLAASPDEGTMHVLKISDGELIARRKLVKTPWLITAGRNLAQLLDTKHRDLPQKTLRILDAVSGATLLESNFEPSVRMTTLEPGIVAAVDASGSFHVIDVRAAKLLLDEQLALSAVPRAIAAMKSGDQLFVGISGPARQLLSRPINEAEYPLIDGQLFAFDLREGKTAWPGPALIEQRGIAVSQPEELPILVFVDRLLKRDAGGAGAKLRLLCLDKQTGATIYRNDHLPDTSGSNFRIHTAHDKSPIVIIDTSAQSIRLTFTDEPRSPEPPANDLVEAPRKNLGRGLWGVGWKMLQDGMRPVSRNVPYGAPPQQPANQPDAAIDD